MVASVVIWTIRHYIRVSTNTSRPFQTVSYWKNTYNIHLCIDKSILIGPGRVVLCTGRVGVGGRVCDHLDCTPLHGMQVYRANYYSAGAPNHFSRTKSSFVRQILFLKSIVQTISKLPHCTNWKKEITRQGCRPDRTILLAWVKRLCLDVGILSLLYINSRNTQNCLFQKLKSRVKSVNTKVLFYCSIWLKPLFAAICSTIHY